MKNKVFTFLIANMLYFTGNSQTVESSSFNVLLKGMLSNSVSQVSVNEIDTCKDYVFVDAREKAEYEVSHLKNSINVGYDNLNLSPLDTVDKNKPIIVYCSIGYRSEKVGEKLKAKGFTNVSNLYGGIFEWKNEGNTVVDSSNQPTEKIHAFSKVWGIWLRKGEKVY
jgi:rhodanese-related sulfurtransferase